jgi:cell division protein FtsN
LALLGVALILLLGAAFGGGVLATLAWNRQDELVSAPAPKPLTPAEPVPVKSVAAAPKMEPDPPAPPAPAAIAPAPPDKQAAEAPPVSTIRLAVMVGSFRDESNASRLSSRLRDLGLEPQQFTLRDSSESVWYAVRLGPLPDWDSASRAAAQVRAETQVAPLIRAY